MYTWAIRSEAGLVDSLNLKITHTAKYQFFENFRTDRQKSYGMVISS